MKYARPSRRFGAFLFTVALLILFLFGRIPRGKAVATVTPTPTATLTPVPIGMVLPTLEAPTELRLDGAIFSWKKVPNAPDPNNYVVDIRRGQLQEGLPASGLSAHSAISAAEERVECLKEDKGRCLYRIKSFDRHLPWILAVTACENRVYTGVVYQCILNPKNYLPSAQATLEVTAIPTPTISPESTVLPVNFCYNDPQGLTYTLYQFNVPVDYREPDDIGGSLMCARWSQTMCVKNYLIEDPEWLTDFRFFLLEKISDIELAIGFPNADKTHYDTAIDVLAEPLDNDTPGYKKELETGELFILYGSVELSNTTFCED